jgi:hypothetical protein
MEYAKKVWIMNNEAVDDITVTVIYFNWYFLSILFLNFYL